MSPHQAFPIADYVEGLTLNREPFLSPRNAFRDLDNGRVFRGRLQKRGGFSVFGSLTDGTEPSVLGSGTYTQAFWTGLTYNAGYFGDAIPETMVFSTENGDAEAITAGFQLPVAYNLHAADQVIPIIATGAGTSGEVIGEYRDGIAIVNWPQHPNGSPAGSAAGQLTYKQVTNDPVVHLPNFQDTTSEYLLALTRTSIYRWDGVTFTLEGSPPWTGDDRTFYWTWPIDTHLVITNGLDPIQRWSSAGGIEPFPINGLTDAVQTAELVVKFGGRFLLLRTTEGVGATQYPRRMRWSSTTDESLYADEDVADAPAAWGPIRTAGYVGERLFVGFESQWAEVYRTGRVDGALAWRPLVSFYGSVAKRTTLEDVARLLTRSRSGIMAVDPNGQYPADPEIPDFVKDIDPSRADVSHAIRSDDDRAFWWAYLDQRNTANNVPNAVLAAQYDEKGNLAWSRYLMSFECFGKFKQVSAPTWDSLQGTWDDYSDLRWDDNVTAEEFPVILGGRSDGVVAWFSPSNSDFGEPIEMRAKSQVIQPMGDQKTHLGWLDIYAQAVAGQEMEITFFDKVGGSGYRTVMVDLSPDPTDPTRKVYRRVRVGRRAFMHQIEIKVNGNAFFALDALVPWFRPAGRVVEFG